MIACGRICAVGEGLVDVEMPSLALGSGVRIIAPTIERFGHVVGVSAGVLRVALRGSVEGIASGMRVVEHHDEYFQPSFVSPDCRRPIDTPCYTGVRAIDSLLTLGRGARIGIFGGPGLGKSTLLETIVHGADTDAIVLALVGERGREAQAWSQRLPTRSTTVCATSDRTPSERVRAAHEAFARARALAARGLDVLLVMDSLARFAFAQRELALACGEPAGRGGYPASVFAEIARLVESAGRFAQGSITLVATVLNDGDDRDPVSEAARSVLDGHIQLSARRAHEGAFPAIDILGSTSRTMADVVSAGHAQAASRVRGALGLLERVRDARSLGMEPVDLATRVAIEAEAALEALLRQGRAPEPPERALAALIQTADKLGEPYEY